jgi:hypothetical protein
LGELCGIKTPDFRERCVQGWVYQKVVWGLKKFARTLPRFSVCYRTDQKKAILLSL